MHFDAKLFPKNADQKTKVSIGSVLVQNVEHKLGFKMQQNNHNVKILLDYQIVLFSCRKKASGASGLGFRVSHISSSV